MSETCQSELALLIEKVSHGDSILHLANHECFDHRKQEACAAAPQYYQARKSAEEDLRSVLKRCRFGEGAK